MITLTFNSTTKTVTIIQDGKKDFIEYQEVPTVKVREGFYEVMQKLTASTETQIPVCRVPISQTIMFIKK
jgi:hypothetical protein